MRLDYDYMMSCKSMLSAISRIIKNRSLLYLVLTLYKALKYRGGYPFRSACRGGWTSTSLFGNLHSHKCMKHENVDA
jgi:hypothetical protein